MVIATFNRDELIIPTLESVCHQTYKDFEVLVVSDGPYSSRLRDIVKEYDSRFSLYSLPTRTRSQSGPNNFGWNHSRGEYIAYLGHDDIWNPQHLENLAYEFKRNALIDFVVAGCVYFGPAGTGDSLTWVTGLFDEKDDEAPRKYFFPPSSFSHKKQLPQDVAKWSDAVITRRPVDSEFLLGAVHHGCKFVSTNKITVYKFASALRYLSYLCPENDEQWKMLAMIKEPEVLDIFIQERVAESRKAGGFLAPRHAEPNQFLPGQKMKMNEVVRGISLPETTELTTETWIGVGEDDRGFDWHLPENHDGKMWRWSGPSHKPRLLIPFTSQSPVKFVLHVLHFAADEIRTSLRLFLNGSEVDSRVYAHEGGFEIPFVSRLRQESISVLELQMNRTAFASEIDPETLDSRRLGLCLSGITLSPVH